MDFKESLHLFVKALDNDLTIGANHLVDDLPYKFKAPDFLYFFAMKDNFWQDIADEEVRTNVSLAMQECYLSALLHVYSGDYTFSESDHHLQDCILYGDLLSGAFSERLITLDRTALLKDWLTLLQTINKTLLNYSLEHRSTEEKKACLIENLVGALAKTEEKEQRIVEAKALLLEGDEQIFSHIPEVIQQAFSRDIAVSNDLQLLYR